MQYFSKFTTQKQATECKTKVQQYATEANREKPFAKSIQTTMGGREFSSWKLTFFLHHPLFTILLLLSAESTTQFRTQTKRDSVFINKGNRFLARARKF